MMRISKMVRLRPKNDQSKGFYVMIVILFMASAFLGFIYSETGNFAMDVDGVPPYDIRISEHITFETPETRLEVTSYVDLNPVNLDDIDLDGIFDQSGQYMDQDHTYLAYSFFLKNLGNETTDIDYYLRFTEVSYWMHDALRILLIEDDLSYTIYQKNANDESDDIEIDILTFMSDSMVFRHEIKDFKVDEVKHFRVIMWLDQSITNLETHKQRSLLKMQFNFVTIYPEVSNQNQLSLDVPKNLWISLSTICNVEFVLIYETEDET